MKRNTKLVGDISEAKVLAALIEAGHRVLVPFGENHRYDLVIDNDGVFVRVQVKTGGLRNGAIEFNGYSSHTHRGGISTRRYAGEIDFFGVYCPQVNQCYLVPIDVVGAGCLLRIEPARNHQVRGIHWAGDYVLTEDSLEKVVGGPGLAVVPFSGQLPS